MVLFNRAQRLFLCWGLMGMTFGGIWLVHRSILAEWNAQSEFRLEQVTSLAPTKGPPLVLQGPPPPPFRILCTATPVVMGWGSFRIRCRDFKKYAEFYFGPHVQIDVISATEAMGHYNATIMIKVTKPGKRVPPLTKIANRSNGTISFGNIFIDVVDNYNLDDARIPQSYHVIVQNDLHAQEVFASRSTHLVHVVPHWFNSFVADVESETPVLPAPVLKKKPSRWGRNDPGNNLTIAMIWNPRAPDHEHAAQVVSIPETGYTFLPMNFEFDIGTWFPDLQGSPYAPNAMGQNESIAAMLADPARGEPYLYLTLFRKYDVLLILGKFSDPNKDRYNSVQRAISQMRSGIPVLLECVPAQAHLCVDYPCGFSTADEMKAALERMKDLKVRQECARKGVEITSECTF